MKRYWVAAISGFSLLSVVLFMFPLARQLFSEKTWSTVLGHPFDAQIGKKGGFAGKIGAAKSSRHHLHLPNGWLAPTRDNLFLVCVYLTLWVFLQSLCDFGLSLPVHLRSPPTLS